MDVLWKINCLHERALRMIYDDSIYFILCFSFRERDNSFSVHDCNIQKLATEMYKAYPGLASKATSVLFLQNDNMQTLLKSEFLVLPINTVYFGQNTI